MSGPTDVQLVTIAKQVYFSVDGRLSDCSLVGGAFMGYGRCPLTAPLAAQYAAYPQGDILACPAQSQQLAPTTYTATVSGAGGTVQVAVPGPAPIAYTISVVQLGDQLLVDRILYSRDGATREVNTENCRNGVPMSP